MSNSNDFGTEAHRERGRGRKAFWIIMGVFVVVGGVYAFWAAPHAAPRRASNHVASEWRVASIASAIDLDEQQEEAFRSVLERARTAVEDVERGEAELRDQLLVVLQSDEIDPTAMASVRSSAAELSASAVDIFLNATTEIWPELTPAQRDDVMRHWQRRADQ
jgi:hypothetical protein